MSRQACAAVALALMAFACLDGVAPTEPPTQNQSPSMGMVTADLGDSTYVSAHLYVIHGGGSIYIQATAWPGSTDTRHYLQLRFETTPVSTPQAIGNAGVWASLSVEFLGGWIASSGTITLTSLTADRAVGTFTFTGNAEGSVTPSVLTVRNGRFDVELK